jgi:hypothetical protein
MAKVIGHLLATYHPMHPAFFTFIILHQHHRAITQKGKIRELYISRMVINRKIDAYEEDLCRELETSFEIAQENNNFVKFVSSIFEYYVEAIMRSEYGTYTIVSCNVLLNGKKFEAHKNHTVDLAIDKLDEKSKILVLAECCLTLRRMQMKKEQIDFYCELLKKIREIVGGSANLQFDMIVADNEKKHWRSINYPSLDLLYDNGVSVYGKTLVSEKNVYAFLK